MKTFYTLCALQSLLVGALIPRMPFYAIVLISLANSTLVLLSVFRYHNTLSK